AVPSIIRTSVTLLESPLPPLPRLNWNPGFSVVYGPVDPRGIGIILPLDVTTKSGAGNGFPSGHDPPLWITPPVAVAGFSIGLVRAGPSLDFPPAPPILAPPALGMPHPDGSGGKPKNSLIISGSSSP